MVGELGLNKKQKVLRCVGVGIHEVSGSELGTRGYISVPCSVCSVLLVCVCQDSIAHLRCYRGDLL